MIFGGLIVYFDSLSARACERFEEGGFPFALVY